MKTDICLYIETHLDTIEATAVNSELESLDEQRHYVRESCQAYPAVFSHGPPSEPYRGRAS